MQVEQGSGSNPPELLASYRYSADNLRAEKQLSDLGQANASQASANAPSASPLAYERTQWDGLHARRSFEITGSNNTQTLRSDTDAAVLAGNTAPWLFSRTEYSNGLGSSSRTTQLHADSQGTLIATVVSESGAAKADSLLHYSAYGLIDSEASGNAGTGLRSNGHSFGSYYADPETGLLYARARYFDPASGQFVSRDPEEGEANLPITWGAYQYARYSPYRYNDPNGKVSVSTMIDNAAEGCGAISCGMYALGKGLYTVATLGFASVHDPVKDAYDEGKVSEKRYWVAGFGGGLAVAALNVVTGAASGAAVGAVSSTAGRMAVAAAMGAGSAAAGDAATQGAHMGAGIQENYNPTQTAIAAGVGGVVGAGSVPLGQAIKSSLDRREVAKALAKELQNSEPVLAAKTPSVGPEQVRPVVKDTTGTIVTEGPKLQAAGELQPQVVSARAGPSGTNGGVDAGVRWGGGIQGQGMPWENYSANQLPTGSRLPPNFKTFDFFDEVTGTAISAKTLDTTTSAKLARPEQIYKSLKANIDATTNFESYTLKGRTVSSDDIAARQLHVAVPEVTTAAQWKQIQQAIQYGQSKGVQVTVTPVR